MIEFNFGPRAKTPGADGANMLLNRAFNVMALLTTLFGAQPCLADDDQHLDTYQIAAYGETSLERYKPHPMFRILRV